ncbi:MAG: hypothetical protein RSE00_02580 [Clostridia bacterium]
MQMSKETEMLYSLINYEGLSEEIVETSNRDERKRFDIVWRDASIVLKDVYGLRETNSIPMYARYIFVYEYIFRRYGGIYSARWSYKKALEEFEKDETLLEKIGEDYIGSFVVSRLLMREGKYASGKKIIENLYINIIGNKFSYLTYFLMQKYLIEIIMDIKSKVNSLLGKHIVKFENGKFIFSSEVEKGDFQFSFLSLYQYMEYLEKIYIILNERRKKHL